MEVQLRKATKQDLPAIHGLVRELAIFERAEEAFVATLDEYERDFEARVFDAFVAELNGRVVGMSLYYVMYSTWKGQMLYLEDFVVEESMRGKGIGKKLFEAFLEEARRRKCRSVKWQVLDWNETAIRFYESYGAEIEKEWYNGRIHFDYAN